MQASTKRPVFPPYVSLDFHAIASETVAMQDNHDDPITSHLLIVGILFVGAGISAWYFRHTFAGALRGLSIATLWLPAEVGGRIGAGAIPLLSEYWFDRAAFVRQVLLSAPADALLWRTHILPGLLLGGWTIAPFLALAAASVSVAGRRIRPDLNYRQQHTLDSIISEHAVNWAAARWAAVVNPQNVIDPPYVRDRPETPAGAGDTVHVSELLPPIFKPLHPGPWMRPLAPQEWMEQHAIPWSDNHCDHEHVDSVLASQLRRRWRGLDSLTLSERAIVACLALFNDGQREETELLADHLSTVFAEHAVATLSDREATAGEPAMETAIRRGPSMVRRIDTILAGDAGSAVAALAEPHFWVETAMVAMWENAREGRGVLPSARFLWFKSVDRTLWYAINVAGGNARYVECAGIWSHYLAEKQLRSPLCIPHVRQARRALIHDYLDLHPARVALRRRRQNAAQAHGAHSA